MGTSYCSLNASVGPPEAALIHLGGVSRIFDGGRILALRDVTLGVHTGELVAIHGPSGSGKSTLVSLMSGIDVPTAGTVSFADLGPPSATCWTALRAARIGIVFQDFNLLPTLTAVENVEIAMFGRERRTRSRRQRALALLDEMGMAHRARQRPQELSGGERRRVGIARSLANEPDILLADEPTSNLDSATGRKTADLLLGLHRSRRITMVIVSHDPTLVGGCPRRIRMLDGQVQEDVSDPRAPGKPC